MGKQSYLKKKMLRTSSKLLVSPLLLYFPFEDGDAIINPERKTSFTLERGEKNVMARTKYKDIQRQMAALARSEKEHEEKAANALVCSLMATEAKAMLAALPVADIRAVGKLIAANMPRLIQMVESKKAQKKSVNEVAKPQQYTQPCATGESTQAGRPAGPQMGQGQSAAEPKRLGSPYEEEQVVARSNL